MATADFKPGFMRTLLALRDYLPHIVIGGGWVPLIYYHYLLGDRTIVPLMTRDIDLMVGLEVPLIGHQSIDRLLSDSGLRVEYRSRHTPPITVYVGQIDGHEVEIQFLTHQYGGGRRAAIEVQPGLHAQALRFISIIADNPIEVPLDDALLANSGPIVVRAPSPAAYIYHKGLAFSRRDDLLKQAKDLYYIFDILANCPQLLGEIVAELPALGNNYPKRWFRQFRTDLARMFADVDAPGPELLISQRPTGALPALDNPQFKRYAVGIFRELLAALE